jgi:hypothetical protein
MGGISPTDCKVLLKKFGEYAELEKPSPCIQGSDRVATGAVQQRRDLSRTGGV